MPETKEINLTKKRLKAAYDIIRILNETIEENGQVDLREVNKILQGVQEFMEELYSVRGIAEIRSSTNKIFETAAKNLDELEKKA